MILAIDPGGSCGYASLSADALEYGVWDLTKSVRCRRSIAPAIELKECLDAYHSSEPIIAIAFEESFAKGDAKFRLDSLCFMIMFWCYDHDVTWRRATPTEWKKACVGKGNATKEEYHRAAVLKWPELEIKTDDEAAALWLLDYVTKGVKE